MKVLLLGATGVTGRRAAGELARSDAVERLVVCARDAEAVGRIATILGGGPRHVEPLVLDVRNGEELTKAARDADVAVSCAGPFYRYEVGVVRCMIEAGTNYVSLCDDHTVTDSVRALDDSARAGAITVISGCGVSPGITNLLTAVAARELDSVEEIEISLAGSAEDPSGVASAMHFVAAMQTEAPAITDHTFDVGRAASSPKLVYFPEPVGWVETFRCGHPEVTTLARAYSDLRAMHFRTGLTERATMDLVRASLATGLLSTERSRRLWLKLSQPLRPVLGSIPPKGAAWTAARVDVRGSLHARRATISLGVVDHVANLAAIPLARGAIEIGTGSVPPGVLTPDEAFHAGDFLAALAKRGLSIARLEPATL